jgi:S1-C subfamily serine protease
VITAIDGWRVDSVETFLGRLRRHSPGDSITVQLFRQGHRTPGHREAHRH